MEVAVKEVLKPQRSIRNRLHSIDWDSCWVREVHESYARPLVPNERCGLWYVDPHDVVDSAYFKSTDGHTNEWSFSTRRLNFHLLPLINSHNGIILVDSTRRGKTIPDALSKTVPLWCATLNYIMNPQHGTESNNWLFTPGQFVSRNEAHSMANLIPQFAERVLELGLTSPEELKQKLGGKYLRPLWVYPGQMLPLEQVGEYEDFHPVICCVASQRADDGMKKMNGYVYVQGAADDHELWAGSLTSQSFWKNREKLLDKSLNDGEILDLTRSLVDESTPGDCSVQDVVVLTSGISIGQITHNADNFDKQFDTVLLLSEKYTSPDRRVIHFPLSCSKKGSNELRKHLPQILSLQYNSILILCESGTDLSPGVALALLATRYNLQWELEPNLLVTKDVVKKHLAKISSVKKVNPSRATLQAINTCIM